MKLLAAKIAVAFPAEDIGDHKVFVGVQPCFKMRPDRFESDVVVFRQLVAEIHKQNDVLPLVKQLLFAKMPGLLAGKFFVKLAFSR